VSKVVHCAWQIWQQRQRCLRRRRQHAHGIMHQHGTSAVEAVRAVHQHDALHNRICWPPIPRLLRRHVQQLKHTETERVDLQRRRRAVRAGALHLDIAEVVDAKLLWVVVALRLCQVHHRRQATQLRGRRVVQRQLHSLGRRKAHRVVAQHFIEAATERHFAGHKVVETQRAHARAVQPALRKRQRVARRVQRDVRGVINLRNDASVRVGATTKCEHAGNVPVTLLRPASQAVRLKLSRAAAALHRAPRPPQLAARCAAALPRGRRRPPFCRALSAAHAH